MAHTFTNLWFHVVFGTKGHSPSIASGVRDPLHGYIGGVVRELKGTALCVNGTSDHIHALIKLLPTMPVADAMRVIKTNSSKWVHETYGRRDLRWQSGYAAFTVNTIPGLTPRATFFRRSAALQGSPLESRG
jgi:putative transposase